MQGQPGPGGLPGCTGRSAGTGYLRHVGALALIVLGGLAFATAAPALEPSATALSHTPGLLESDVIPRLLSSQDARLYRRVFALLDKGEWAAADGELARLSDRTLLGYVLAQRYLNPAYKASYAELKTWLERYGDQPGAEGIFGLAMSRKPKKEDPPRRLVPSPDIYTLPVYTFTRPDLVGAGGQRNLRQQTSQRKSAVAAQDEMRLRRAASAFFNGEDAAALAIASPLSDRTREALPLTDWIAGLAAWRQGKPKVAATHFHALAQSEVASAWERAAGGVWAARAYLVDRQPAMVNRMLALAAEHDRTFYGLIAQRMLGREPSMSWSWPPLDRGAAQQLARLPAVRRAIALAEVGQHSRADGEIRLLLAQVDPQWAPSVLALALQLKVPVSQVQLAKGVERAHGRLFDSAYYPLPPWRPEGGFTLEPALLFAFMRQESGFKAGAESAAGARGLMQLMPGTASFVANDPTLREHAKAKLFEPELNLQLGQKYLEHLMGQYGVKGNLFFLAAAYNGGPGKLEKWQKAIDYKDDPLLFIESLPSGQTRDFVERVIANYWIYCHRMGVPTPSLDQVAEGDWPRYLSGNNGIWNGRSARN